jgi:hypothetical protein
MTDQPLEGVGGLLRRALWGSLAGFGLFVISVGIANLGFIRILGVAIGLALTGLAFTAIPRRLAEGMVIRTSTRMAKFWAVWISGGAILVPMIGALFPIIALAGGVPMNLTFGSLIVGAGLCSLLNLVVLLSNLIGYRSA